MARIEGEEVAELGIRVRARFRKNGRGEWIGECFDEAGRHEFTVRAGTEAEARRELAARVFEEAAKSVRADLVEGGGIVWHTCGKHDAAPPLTGQIRVAVVSGGRVALEVADQLHAFTPDAAEGIADNLRDAATVARLPPEERAKYRRAATGKGTLQ